MVEQQYQFFNLVHIVFERILVSSAPGSNDNSRHFIIKELDPPDSHLQLRNFYESYCRYQTFY